MSEITRRAVLRGAAGLAGVAALGGLAACNRSTGTAVGPAADAVAAAEAARRKPGARVVTARLTAQPVTLDLGGQTVSTWAYGDTAPGPLLRVDAGDVLRVDVANQLPDATSVHWHGLALRNDMARTHPRSDRRGRDVPIRVHRTPPGHVLLPPALRSSAGPRPVRHPDRRRPSGAR